MRGDKRSHAHSYFYYKWAHLWGGQFKRGVCHEYNPSSQCSYWQTPWSRQKDGLLEPSPGYSHAVKSNRCLQSLKTISILTYSHQKHYLFCWTLPANSLQLPSFIMTSFPGCTSSHSIFHDTCKGNVKYLLSHTTAERFICKMRSLHGYVI